MTTALVTIPEARKNGALVYVNEGYLQPSTPLYRTEVTAIKLDVKNDCYNISGKLMPKREVVDRVAEASAISYVPSGCRTWAEIRDDCAGKRTVFISEQQGKMRLPDGSYRTSAIEAYEFDPNLRAMLDVGVDEWNEKTRQQRKDNTGKTVAMRAMEYAKFGRQRAETGARLRVVKALTGMPTAFSPEEAARPLVFSRVVQNTDYLLKTPEGRMLAAAQATGTQDVIAALYGKQALPGFGGEAAAEMRNVTEGDGGSGAAPAGENLANEAAAEDWTRMAPAASRKDEFTRMDMRLEEYVVGCKDQLDIPLTTPAGKQINPYEQAVKELNNPDATVESHQDMLNRIEAFLKKQEGYR
jgi:hypothetical protein